MMTNGTAEQHPTSPSSDVAGWRRPRPGDHRGPCPALNSLANGGHIPRDGRVTADQLVRAIEVHIGLVPSIGRLLAKAAIDRLGKEGEGGARVLDLADLALHGFIEHDASLTRRDARHGDAVELARPLLEQLLSLSVDGKTLTRDDLAVAHQLRMEQSAARGRAPSIKAGILGSLEAALLFLVLSRDGVIAVEDAVEFLENERLPEHLAPRPIGWGTILATTAAMAATGNVPVFAAAKRARAARGTPDPEGHVA